MRSGPSVLVCLDLQRGRLSGVSDGADRSLEACRRVLEQARRRRWPILHVHRREATLEDGRPIVGLEPLPSEPIYLRSGPSAFSHRGFCQAARAYGGPLALIGFSLCDSVLATAFAAVDRDLTVEVVRDAVALGGGGDLALRQALAAPLVSLSPMARIIDSQELFIEDAGALAAANAP
ncbi:isochorismatase family protein [Phenylobacterium sp.]|uniref:isochorismatase family protein n=1 Tax=Phenylobacterium sp. TaxID=1871053 RepID=UPI002733B6E1|nr:isochorismatase family protein [Phenylobacterium sp.]MDP3853774.1 isochorismatase family protein [Phenylobacterium sp.]